MKSFFLAAALIITVPCGASIIRYEATGNIAETNKPFDFSLLLDTESGMRSNYLDQDSDGRILDYVTSYNGSVKSATFSVGGAIIDLPALRDLSSIALVSFRYPEDGSAILNITSYKNYDVGNAQYYSIVNLLLQGSSLALDLPFVPVELDVDPAISQGDDTIATYVERPGDYDPVRVEGGRAAVSHLSISAVPEPGTWVIVVGGFGLMGRAIRGRRRVETTLAR